MIEDRPTKMEKFQINNKVRMRKVNVEARLMKDIPFLCIYESIQSK